MIWRVPTEPAQLAGPRRHRIQCLSQGVWLILIGTQHGPENAFQELLASIRRIQDLYSRNRSWQRRILVNLISDWLAPPAIRTRKGIPIHTSSAWRE